MRSLRLVRTALALLRDRARSCPGGHSHARADDTRRTRRRRCDADHPLCRRDARLSRGRPGTARLDAVHRGDATGARRRLRLLAGRALSTLGSPICGSAPRSTAAAAGGTDRRSTATCRCPSRREAAHRHASCDRGGRAVSLLAYVAYAGVLWPCIAHGARRYDEQAMVLPGDEPEPQSGDRRFNTR